MRIILVGPGACGKDHLKSKLQKKGLVTSVSHTTRPIRVGEVDGRDYSFVSEAEFKRMIDAGEFREYNYFGEKWYYGATKERFTASTLAIMTPSGVRALTPKERAESWIIYLDIPEDIRRERLKKRKDADDPERRIKTDREDFADFTDYDTRFTNPDF
jgi:guanylate kinase